MIAPVTVSACAAVMLIACNGSVVNAKTNPDATLDGAPASCGSIADYCSRPSAGCVLTWDAAKTASPWCAAVPDGDYSVPLDYPNVMLVLINPACGSWNVAQLYGSATTTLYTYDPASGALVGVSEGVLVDAGQSQSNIEWSCVAGTPAAQGSVVCYDGALTAPACSG